MLLVFGGVYYFFTKASIFDRASAENLSQLDTYLTKNYSLTFNLEKRTEDAIRIYCDPLVATTTTEGQTIAYPCQNQNPIHKIIIGWVGAAETHSSVMRKIGNEQLFWRNYGSAITEEGDITCTERGDYAVYRSAVFGVDCILLTTGGQKLFSSAFFLQSSNNADIQTFVAVVNTVQSSSAQKVDQELLTLISQQKKAATQFKLHMFTGAKPSSFEGGSASSSALFSTEKDSTVASYSSNTVTQNTGSGVDSTVCDITDITNCYPLYCQSVTAVWNYSLNKCVEPESSLAINKEDNCPKDLPVWDGSKCRELVGNILTGNTCAIPDGGSSCTMNVFWSVQYPNNSVDLKQMLSNTESLILGSGKTGNINLDFPYQTLPHLLSLYDGQEKVQEAKFITTCLSGGWNSIDKKCSNPRVSKVTIAGEYYITPGILNFSCEDANYYMVKNGDLDIIAATGTYFSEVHIPIVKSGNYSISCQSGDYSGAPVVRYYNAPPPPPPTLTFNILPRTISKNEKVLLLWDIDFPRDTCELKAKVICKNNICGDAQLEYENITNQILKSEGTDEDDPEGSRLITSALATIAPSRINVDWKATGQKTLEPLFTTDFTLSCMNVPAQKKRVYVRGGRE